MRASRAPELDVEWKILVDGRRVDWRLQAHFGNAAERQELVELRYNAVVVVAKSVLVEADQYVASRSAYQWIDVEAAAVSSPGTTDWAVEARSSFL